MIFCSGFSCFPLALMKARRCTDFELFPIIYASLRMLDGHALLINVVFHSVGLPCIDFTYIVCILSRCQSHLSFYARIKINLKNLVLQIGTTLLRDVYRILLLLYKGSERRSQEKRDRENMIYHRITVCIFDFYVLWKLVSSPNVVRDYIFLPTYRIIIFHISQLPSLYIKIQSHRVFPQEYHHGTYTFACSAQSF